VPQIIIHLVVTVPIVIWIMIGYFETTPLELEEAALIDGATRWQVFPGTSRLPIARTGHGGRLHPRGDFSPGTILCSASCWRGAETRDVARLRSTT